MARKDGDELVRTVAQGLADVGSGVPVALPQVRRPWQGWRTSGRIAATLRLLQPTGGVERELDAEDHGGREIPTSKFTYVDEAAHFITDDTPAAVADLAIDWFERAA